MSWSDGAEVNLSQLIATYRGDRSNLQLAADSGNRPSPQRWGDLANGKPLKNFPDPPTIRAISSVLGVNERMVVLACAESLGLDMSEFAKPIAARRLTAVTRADDLVDEVHETGVPSPELINRAAAHEGEEDG